jgi:hypothetical protein
MQGLQSWRDCGSGLHLPQTRLADAKMMLRWPRTDKVKIRLIVC